MVDVVIRGMEMPDRRTAELMHTELACVSRECDRHCENCDLVQDRDELIAAFHEAIRVLETVANAVSLPAGHGRLIDADSFKADCLAATKDAKPDFVRHEDWLKSCAVTMSFCRDIDERPTIVPAEGGRR